MSAPPDTHGAYMETGHCSLDPSSALGQQEGVTSKGAKHVATTVRTTAWVLHMEGISANESFLVSPAPLS